MEGKLPLCKLLLNSLTILQLVYWNLAAHTSNNYTIIKLINSMNTSWKAGENPTDVPSSFPKEVYKRVAVTHRKVDNISIPPTFDARTHWKHCDGVISRVKHQYQCGSCWAAAVTSMLSDRICIETKGAQRVQLSVEDVITCCEFCRRKKNRNSCSGARMFNAAFFWVKEGIVTGGELDSNQGCKPYSNASAEAQHQTCARSCTNKSYPRKYSKDKHFGKRVYNLPPREDVIKVEIFSYGPVATVMAFHDDFRQYKSGVYRHQIGKYEGMHSVKLIGWGEERNIKYWLAANTWGSKWGMNGYVKFLRGENHCKIESSALAGTMFDKLSTRHVLAPSTIGANKADLIGTSCIGLEVICFLSLYSNF